LCSPRDEDGSVKDKESISCTDNDKDDKDDDDNNDKSSPKSVDDTSATLRATPEMCHYCFHLLIKKVTSASSSLSSSIISSDNISDNDIIPSFLESLPDPAASCPLFITWDIRKRRNGYHGLSPSEQSFELRGCIGTLAPRPLRSALKEYALMSAFHDRRFHPIDKSDVPHLRVSVSLLVNYEECSHCHDWVVGVHGILIKFTHRLSSYSATYLPEVAMEQGWSQQEAVQSLMRKAGYRGEICDSLLGTVNCTRYQSSKERLTYQEHVQIYSGENDPLLSPLESSSSSSSSLQKDTGGEEDGKDGCNYQNNHRQNSDGGRRGWGSVFGFK